jgi:hypothetical protein
VASKPEGRQDLRERNGFIGFSENPVTPWGRWERPAVRLYTFLDMKLSTIGLGVSFC